MSPTNSTLKFVGDWSIEGLEKRPIENSCAINQTISFDSDFSEMFTQIYKHKLLLLMFAHFPHFSRKLFSVNWKTRNYFSINIFVCFSLSFACLNYSIVGRMIYTFHHSTGRLTGTLLKKAFIVRRRRRKIIMELSCQEIPPRNI